MAFWQHKSVKGRTYVFVYTRIGGRQVTVPRAEYKHLDGAPDCNVDAWVRDWSLKHEGPQPTGGVFSESDPLWSRVEAWGAFLRQIRRRSPNTISKYRSLLIRYVLPYFQEQGLADPAQWPGVSVRLFDTLHSRGLTRDLIAEINNAFRSFFYWLQEEGLVAWEGKLRLRNTPRAASLTPLAFTATPTDIRTWHGPDDLRLLGLLGYFFSLRPQEIVALRPQDFRAGGQVALLECGRVMQQAHLYGRLAVHIHRQRVGQEFSTPKASSHGWVACFDEQAARSIVAAVRDRPPTDLLFPRRLDHYYKAWRATGYPGLTLKDLRRASLYWLGHYTHLPFAALKNHARHADPSTTALYTRRPGSEVLAPAVLDLDA